MTNKNDLRHVIEEWTHDNYEISSEDDKHSARSVALIGAEQVINKAELWGIGDD